MARTVDGRRSELAAHLRTVRAGAFRSGQRFAEHLGWPQSRVSKLETGAQMPTEEDIDAWVAGAGAPPEIRVELLSLLAEARVEYVNNRELGRPGGLARNQAWIRELEAEANRLAAWLPAMMPGLVQTPAYTRELLGRPGRPTMALPTDAVEVEGLIGERVRRQEILYKPGRQIQLYIGEAALHSMPGSVDTLLGQLDRLTTLVGLTTVEIGLIPFPAMPIIPLSGFELRDDVVSIETLTGEQRISDPDEVAVYLRALDVLHDSALFGDDAVALIKRAIGRLSAPP